MSSFTPRLTLKRNDGSDPFKRQDFTDNWNKLDAAPGLHVCTSTTRPNTWGAAQAGRRIAETDTGRTLEWSGTAWREPRVAVGQWMYGLTPSTYVNADSFATFTFGTLTVLRPCHLTFIMSSRVAARPYLYQGVWCEILWNDVNKTTGLTGSTFWADVQTTSTQYDHRSVTTLGQTPVTVPGNYTLKHRLHTGDFSSNNVFLAYTTIAVLVTAGNGGASTLL